MMCGATAFAGAGDDNPDLNYEALAQQLLDDLGSPDASAATFEFEELLQVGFLRANLGAYDLYIVPDDASDKRGAAKYRQVGITLLRAQRKWLDWMKPTIGEQPELRADLATVEGWVDSWRASKLKIAARTANERQGGDLLVLLDPSEEVKAANERVRAYMAGGKPVGLDRDIPRTETIILVPNRRRFANFVAFAGWLRPELQDTFWIPGISTWTNFYVDEYKVMTTEFADLGSDGGFGPGIPMDIDTKTGLEQQITQLATNSLIDNYFGSKVPPAFAGGLSVNLVVDIYGECNTRVDGDLGARRTEAREQFVPGGNSEGGLLPKTEADSRWRVKRQGGDRFVDMLKEAQRAGGKKAKRGPMKIARFELQNDDRNKRHTVQGPFLGAAAANLELPPDEFDGDWQEFLRAYRTCFVYWLQNETTEDREASNLNFAKLLTDLANADEVGAIESTVSTNFGGAGLSAADMADTALETRFLTWLTQARVKPPKVKF